MQLTWVEAAEKAPVTPLSHPDAVHRFIHEHPGLWETCNDYPGLVAEYAPQLTIRGFEGDLLETIERAYQESCRKSAAVALSSPKYGTAITRDHKPPFCDERWALRAPEFANFTAVGLAEEYFSGGIFGPPVSPFEHADHLFWLLSSASTWLPPDIRLKLTTGMAEWSVWHWHTLRSTEWLHQGELFTAMSKASESRTGAFKWTPARLDLLTMMERSIQELKLPETVEQLHAIFLRERIAELHVEHSRAHKLEIRRREAKQARATRRSRRL
jgi:hypothetical protein